MKKLHELHFTELDDHVYNFFLLIKQIRLSCLHETVCSPASGCD